MVNKSIIGATCACLAVVSFNANAALVSRLGGLAYYDDVADLTWLADANYAQTSGYDSDGVMNWVDANNWAAGLDVAGVTGWRLADTLQPDASCDTQSGGDSYGYNCTGSELGKLFYNVLGGSAGSDITTTYNANYYLFDNVQSYFYWSATEYSPDSRDAWTMAFHSGFQSDLWKDDIFYAWAVQSGDISAVPEPATVWLIGSGLLGLIGVARMKVRV